MTLKRIPPDEALELMEDGWSYVDVRTPGEFEGGHPEGAYNVPWAEPGPSGMTPNESFLAVMEKTFGKDGKIIVGCQRGGRSKAAAQALLAAGFTHIVDQLAGYGGATDAFGQTIEAGWQAAGLPIAIEAEPGRSWDDLQD